MSEVDWFYAKDGVRLGPVPGSLLRDMARMGTLQPRDLVWTNGMPQWRAAGGVADVFGAPEYAGSGRGANPDVPGYENAAEGLFYAGFWIRFAANFIDWLILAVPVYGFAHLLVAFFDLDNQLRWGNSPVPAIVELGARLTYFLAAWVYHATQESGPHMATVGKRLCGVVVTDLGGARATGRHFAKLLSDFTCGIGYVMAAFTGKHQALHDMVASTVVVYK